MTVLRILSDGRFHSGSSVGETLGISRAAVWKTVQKLQQEWQVKINAVSGRGYQLATPLELLDKGAIVAAIQPQYRDQLPELHILSSVDSTNRYALDQVMKGSATGLAVLAEHQTAGRGRRGRNWVSPFGRNLYLSLVWKFELDARHLSGLSLAIAVAILRALVKLDIEGVGLKWPNDVLWQEKKLGGVLLEMRGEANGPWLIVIGIGMNVNMEAVDANAIDQPWVDLQTIQGRHIDRNLLAGVLLDELIQAVSSFQQSGLASFLSEWREHDICLNCPVALHFPNRVQQGIARGIDADGALLLETDGIITPYHAGEVSLRVSPHGR